MLNNGSGSGGISGGGGGGSGGSSCGSNSGMGTPTDSMYGGGPGSAPGGGGTSPSPSSEYPPSNFPTQQQQQQYHLQQQQQQQQQQHNRAHSHHPHHHQQHPHHQQQHHQFHNQQQQGGGGGGPQSPMGNGMLGHHSGGICSQMGLNHHHNHHQGGGPNSCGPQDSKIRSCGGCGEGILDRVLFEAWDRYWHHSCLKCTICGCQLADIGPTCFSRDGMMLCKQDYVKMFGIKGACRGCGSHIPANEFVMRAGGGPMGGGGVGGPPMVFHVSCFTCSKCGKTLATGDRYSVLNGALLCEQDALKVMKQNGIGSPGGGSVGPASNGPTTAPRKGKVGRPRRSRD